MKIIIISAMTKKKVIGLDNKLPWKIKEELDYFRQVTLNKPIIMGSNTFISLRKPLINRYNIVLTKNIHKFNTIIESVTKRENNQMHQPYQIQQPENLIFVDSIQNSLYEAEKFYLDKNINKLFKGINNDKQEVFIIGGREIYLQFLPLADQLYLSIIKYDYAGNVFFPEINIHRYQLIDSKDYKEFITQIFQKNSKV